MRQWAETYFTDAPDPLCLTDPLRQFASTLPWWQILALALLDMNRPVRVRDLYTHPLVRARVEQASFSRNVRALIWSTLQLHTAEHCPHVNVSRRYYPTIFWKDEQSRWSILPERMEQRAPDLAELFEEYRALQAQTMVSTRYAFITFHPSYSYEEFVEGIRPVTDEDTGNLRYEVRPGIFRQMVHRARQNPSQNYALFIDEINRGPLTQIFGELITLLEPDKRAGMPHALQVTLPYSGEIFSIPPNLYLIGAMNTADRSIALLDVALRRRFDFLPLYPDSRPIEALVGNKGVIKLSTGDTFNVVTLFRTLNRRIEALYDRDHTLGHSYFLHIRQLSDLKQLFLDRLLPLLEEYFYEDWKKIARILGAPVRADGRQENPYPILLAETIQDPVLHVNGQEQWMEPPLHFRIHPTFLAAEDDATLLPFFTHIVEG